MIDPGMERMYDIIFSVFIGIIFVLLFDQMVGRPRIVEVYLEKGGNIEKRCINSENNVHL